MRNVIIKDNDGKETPAFIPETSEDLQAQISRNKKQNLKEHLYLGFLMLGIVSFGIGIYISVLRLKGNK
jgi:hypothetical protein